MKVIMHCGQPKTGTTALQVSLWQARESLRRHRVSYPDGQALPRHTHKSLAPLFLDPEHLSAHLTHRGVRPVGIDVLAARGRRSWDLIRRELDRARPHAVVLSAETFCGLRTVEEAQRLRRLLTSISDDITLVTYVRNPADRYLSALRQHAKSRGQFIPPRPMRLRPFVESVEAVLPGAVDVRVYARQALVGADVVADFVAAYLQPWVPSGVVPTVDRNDSVSTEAAAILIAFRENALPDTVGFNVAEGRALKDLAFRADAALPRSRPDRLKPHVREAILRASPDLDWLQERYGLELPGVDYPVNATEVDTDIPGFHRVEDVCDLDRDRQEALSARILGDLVEARLRHGPPWWRRIARQVEPHVPIGLRDRLVVRLDRDL